MDRNRGTRTDGALAVAGPVFARELRVRPARRRDLLSHFSGAFDLAEDYLPGHAARVAFLGHQVARSLGLGPEGVLRTLDAGLLHAAGGALHVGLSEADGNAWVATRLGLAGPVVEALRAVQERWDGAGGPLGRAGTDVPVEALCVAAAHWASDYADDVGHPLRARALLQRVEERQLLPLVGPSVADALREVLRDDETWLTVFSDDLPGIVARIGATETKPSRGQVQQTVEAMGAVIDAAVRAPDHSLRVATLARAIAEEIGMSEGACELIALTGHLLDIGQLGVPRAIAEKPSILTVDEMEAMRRHPGIGARLLEPIPGFDEVTLWVEQHHERPDGRGYPSMLDGDEFVLPARILAVADAYWALCAHRPYRPAYRPEEALEMLRAGADRQFDADAVMALDGALLRTTAALGERRADDGPPSRLAARRIE